MSYTSPWNEGLPDGSEDANTIATLIANLKRDLRERMETLVGAGNWSTDPVPYPVVTLTLPSGLWYAGISTIGDTIDVSSYSLHPTATAGTQTVMVPIVLPVGAKLTKVEAQVNRVNTSATIIMRVWKRAWGTEFPVAVSSEITAATTGWQTLTASGLSEVVADGVGYLMTVYLTPDGTTADTAEYAQGRVTYQKSGVFQ